MASGGNDEDKKLNKIKSEIRSLLISHPSKSVPLNRFLNDFKDSIGKPLPFKEFNFNTPLQFLCSLTDTVKVIDADDGPNLVPVVNVLSRHINQMVERQKKPAHCNRKGPSPRRPVYTAHHAPSGFVRNPVMNEPYSTMRPVPPQIFYGAPIFMRPVPLMSLPQMRPSPGFSYPGVNSNGTTYYNNPCPPSNFNGWPYANLEPTMATHPVPQEPSATDCKTFDPQTDDEDVVEPQISCNDASETDSPDDDALENEDIHSTPNIQHPDISMDSISSDRRAIEKSFALFNSTLRHSTDPVDRKTFRFTIPDITTDTKNDAVNCPSDTQETMNHDDHPSTSHRAILPHYQSTPCLSVISPLSSDIKSKIWALLEKEPNGISTNSFLSSFKIMHSHALDVDSLGYSSLKEMVWKNEDVFSFEKTKVSDDWILHDARLKPKRRQSEVQRKEYIPHIVIDNLAALARKYPEGIDADCILDLYKEEYSTEINLKMLGFHSLNSFLENCKSIYLKLYGDKGIVYPKGWAPTFDNNRSEDVIKEPAVPPPEELKDLWKDYFKEYECDPSFKYKPPLIPEENKVLKVKIVDVSSPALMWIHFLDNLKSLSEMMLQLNLHYDAEEENYVLPENIAIPGLAIVSMFQGKWHRASIASVTSPDVVEVFYVDYGTICSANISDLRKLDRRFGKDQVYAIKASLYCLIPYSGDTWPVETCEFIYNNWGDTIVFAEVCRINFQEPSIDVLMYDTSSDTEVNIGNLLIEKQLARYLAHPFIFLLFAVTWDYNAFLSRCQLNNMTKFNVEAQSLAGLGSVISERTISKLNKLLPPWISFSTKNDPDLNLCCQNLLLSTAGGSEPINHDLIPCCKLHCIQTFYKANPGALATLWENAIKLEEERLMNHVLHQLEVSLEELGWECCKELKMRCKTSRPQTAHEQPSHYEDNLINELSNLTVNVNAPKLDHDRTSVLESSNNLSNGLLKHDYSNNTSVGKRYSDDLHVYKKINKPVKARQSKLRVTKHLETKVGRDCPLTLISFQREIRVSLAQLFGIAYNVPRMLAKHRLGDAHLELERIHVARVQYPDLYNDLLDLNLIESGEETVLVLLKDAPRIIRAVDPLVDYLEVFQRMAQDVEPMLDRLFE